MENKKYKKENGKYVDLNLHFHTQTQIIILTNDYFLL